VLTPEHRWAALKRRAASDRAQKRKPPPAIILQHEPHKFSVAVWRRGEDAEAVYEITHEGIRDVSVAAALAREATKASGQ
jgi:hypothetical protein